MAVNETESVQRHYWFQGSLDVSTVVLLVYIRMPYTPADARCEKFSFLCKQHHSSTNRRSPVLFCVQPLNQKIKKNIMRKLGKISQIARISCSTSGAKGIDPQEFLPSTTTIQTCMAKRDYFTPLLGQAIKHGVQLDSGCCCCSGWGCSTSRPFCRVHHPE